MAQLSFWTSTNNINNLAGSGLGFYGSAFGNSVPVGQYQSSTYVTDPTGTIQGATCDNIKYVHPLSGVLNGGLPTGLRYIPNQHAQLNIRFENYDTSNNPVPVQVQAAQIIMYDRSSTANPPSGVTTQIANLIHPSTSMAVLGSGDSNWNVFYGSSLGIGQYLNLPQSPGSGGNYAASGSVHQDAQHDFYLAISASPDTIGSKSNYAIFYSCEYL